MPGGYRFSFARRLGDVTLVVIDARNGRVLEPGNRSIVDDDEWAWIVRNCETDARHLLIGSSLPAFVPGGIHDLQRWNERVCDGAWGRLGVRLGERVRRALDLEDWPAFGRSFDALVALLTRARKCRPARPRPRRSPSCRATSTSATTRSSTSRPPRRSSAASIKSSTLPCATRSGPSSAKRCSS